MKFGNTLAERAHAAALIRDIRKFLPLVEDRRHCNVIAQQQADNYLSRARMLRRLRGGDLRLMASVRLTPVSTQKATP